MSHDRTWLWSMLALSFSTGVLDAATYLGLHGVFTANMTGNLIFLSLGLTGRAEVPLLRAGLALAGFAGGAALAGRLQRRRVPRWPGDPFAAVGITAVACLLVACAVIVGVTAESWVLNAVTFALAAGSGAQAMVARRVGIADVTTVVITSTLAGLAGENRVASGAAGPGATSRRALSVLSMGIGAMVGALALLISVSAALCVAAAVTWLVAAIAMIRAIRQSRAAAVTSADEDVRV